MPHGIANDPKEDKRKGLRIALDEATYKWLIRLAADGGYISIKTKPSRNAAKEGIEALIKDAMPAIEYHVETKGESENAE